MNDEFDQHVMIGGGMWMMRVRSDAAAVQCNPPRHVQLRLIRGLEQLTKYDKLLALD